MFRLNEKGMTLVETMVAAGLLGGLAVAGMTLFKTQNKAQKTVEVNYEVSATLNAIRSILSDSTNCRLSVGNNVRTPNTGTGSITQLVKRVGATTTNIYRVNTDLPGTQLKISSYALSQAYPNVDPASETMLVINFARGSNVQTNAVTKTVKLNYTLTSANIQECNAVAATEDSVWELEGTIGPDIYYPGGNVGIGTSNPDELLHLANSGAIRFDGAGDQPLIYRNSGTRSGTPTGDGFRLRWQGNFFGGSSGALVMEITDGNQPTPDSGISVVNTGNDGIVEPAFTVRGNNRVGIGTISPLFNFHVMSPGVSTAAYLQSDQTSTVLGFADSTTTTRAQVGSFGNDLFFQTLGNARMYVKDNGYVGIGTASPVSKLELSGGSDVASRLTLHNSGTGANNVTMMFRSVNTDIAAVQANTSDNLSGSLRFLTSLGGTSSTKMVVQPDGNVGIGTTGPTAPFHLRTASAAGFLLERNVAMTSSIEYRNASTNFYAGLSATGNFSVGRNLNLETGPLLVVEPGGNVGISRASPTSTLDVNGWIQGVTPNAGTTGGVRIRGGAGNTPAILQFTNNAGSSEWGNWTATSAGHMYATPLGSVGIGLATTTAPAEKLHVAGNIRADGYLYSSDRRLKDNIQKIESPLERVSKLEGREFTWKESGKKDMGFIAQEVKRHEPSLVVSPKDDGMLSVKYGNITAILVEAIKEIKVMISELFKNDEKLVEQIELLKSQNAALEARLQAQEARIEKQEKLLNDIKMRDQK